MDYSSQNFKKYCSVVDKLQSQKEANLEADSAGIKMSSTFSIAYTSWHKFVHAGWHRSEFWRKGVAVLGWERIETGDGFSPEGGGFFGGGTCHILTPAPGLGNLILASQSCASQLGGKT